MESNISEKSADYERRKTEHTSQETEEVVSYGWRKFRPGFLQVFNNPKCFLVVIMMYTLGAGVTMNGLLAVVLPTMEKRFSLTSKELGVLAASNDVAAIGLAVFIGFYGDYGNKIKWVGGGAAIAGIGVLLFTLPHPIVGRYEVTGFRSATTGLCQLSSNTTSCDGGSGQHAAMWYFMFIFVIAQLIHGAGICPLYSLVPAYLDENVEPNNMAMYLGVWYLCAFLGPGMGALLGAQFLAVFVDIDQPEGVKLTPKDPRWIGAWWLGFVIFGLLFLVLAVVILGFPSSLPGARERRQKHIKEGTLRKADNTKEAKIKEFIPQLKYLFTNTTFLFMALGTSISLIFVYAFIPFFAKILQLKFDLDPVRNGNLISAILIPTITVGVLLGSFITKQFELKSAWKQFILFIAACQSVTVLFSAVILIPGCENANIAGVSTPYLHSSRTLLRDACFVDCRCSLKEFSPVCGSDNITYLNPCYAGCTTRLADKTFENCSCATSTSKHKYGTAKPGYCDRDCKNLTLFLVIVTFILLVNICSGIPLQVIILRCVPDNKRSFAMSTQYVMVKGLGFLPGAIVFGHLLDVCCRLWQDICGVKGRCFDYDVHQVNRNISILAAVCCGTATMLFFLAWYLYKPVDSETEKTTVIQNPTAVTGGEETML